MLYIDLAAFNAGACLAYGRGIQPRGLRVNEKADFFVTTKDAGEAELDVVVKGPSMDTCMSFFIYIWFKIFQFKYILAQFQEEARNL